MRRTLTNHRVIAEACRATPGEWQRVRTYPSWHSAISTVSHIRRGFLPAYSPAGAFDAEARRDEDGEAVVYARYTATDRSA